MRAQKRYWILALIWMAALVVVLLFAGVWSTSMSEDARAARELRSMHASLSQYLKSHDYHWPQTTDASAEAKAWWASFEAKHDTLGYQVAQFDSTPNEAFRYAYMPWVSFVSKDGRKHAIFPDGRVE